jgi:hypothetical protein
LASAAFGALTCGGELESTSPIRTVPKQVGLIRGLDQLLD